MLFKLNIKCFFFLIKKIHFLFWQEIEQANKTMEELHQIGWHAYRVFPCSQNIHMPLSRKIAFDFDCGIL